MVLAATDVIAAGVLHGAAELGLRVPQDLSVVGFDDIRMSACLVPALTTVRMPTEEMVAAALGLARRSMGDPQAARPPERLVFQPDLVVRGSTAAAPG